MLKVLKLNVESIKTDQQQFTNNFFAPVNETTEIENFENRRVTRSMRTNNNIAEEFQSLP